VRDRLTEYKCVKYLSTWPGKPFKDKLINGTNSAWNTDLRILEYSYCLYSKEDKFGVHESVHFNTTMKITNKMHYID
jgi:hypothetical protein